MSTLLKRRSRSIAAIGAGAVVALLMGNLVAMTSDSIRSQGNNVRSGEYTPAAHILQVAVLEDANKDKNCATATYTDADTIALVDFAAWGLSWGWEGVEGLSGRIICVRNAGTATGQLVVTADNVVDTEVGACASNEVSVGNDTTCGDGAPGELSQAFTVSVFGLPASDWAATSTCLWTSRMRLSGLANPSVLQNSLSPGASCAIQTDAVTDGPTAAEQLKAVAQTDRTTWDYVFTLRDP